MCLQACIFYGIWPTVVRGLMDRLANNEFGYSLRFEEVTGFYRLWMTFVMNDQCWNVVVAEFAREHGWESKLLEFLGRLYTPVVKMVSPVGIHAPCAPTILDVLGTDLYGHTSARLPLFNQLWFEQTFRRACFCKSSKGMSPLLCWSSFWCVCGQLLIKNG